VYRAHDTNLSRDVSIKVLPAALAQDPDRLARFEREAKVLAALNHPKIAAPYGARTGRRLWAGDGVGAWGPLLMGTGAASGDALLETLLAAQAIAVYSKLGSQNGNPG
jgi:serine/threonine protein kinase